MSYFNEISFEKNLMLNPLSYIHKQRFSLPDGLTKPRQLAVINEILLKHYSLEVILKLEDKAEIEVIKNNKPTALIFKNWQFLPQIVFLLACQRLRADLVRRGFLLQLPLWAQKFAQMPLRDSRSDNQIRILSKMQLMAYGLAELLSWKNHLPNWLRQRIRLLFSPACDSTCDSTCDSLLGKQNLIDIELFNLTAQYAKSNFDPTFT